MPELILNTGERLVEAAAALLDSGGEAAVTLRAVAQAVGVSHSAPYRHFADRAALLAAVAERDFGTLTDAFSAADKTRRKIVVLVPEAETLAKPFRDRCDNYFG